MLSIVEKLVNSETDKRLVISRESLGRALNPNIDWSGIRIGIRASTHWTGSVPSLIFQLGLCDGSKSLLHEGVNNHFLGFRSQSGSWGAASSGYYRTGRTFEKVVNNTSALIGSWGDPYWLPNSDNGRGVFILDIIKGNPNFSLASYASNRQNMTLESFSNIMFGSIFTLPPGLTSQGTSYNIAIDESINGTLDTLAISWAHTTALEISDLAVRYYI